MKLIPVDNAEGRGLGHDITEIVPGRFKGPAFKRGHVIRPEDVERLRDIRQRKHRRIGSRIGLGA